MLYHNICTYLVRDDKEVQVITTYWLCDIRKQHSLHTLKVFDYYWTLVVSDQDIRLESMLGGYANCESRR